MYRIYAKNLVYFNRHNSLSPEHGFIMLNYGDLQNVLATTDAGQLKIYSEDGKTYFEVKDGALVESTDPDIVTNTLNGNEPTLPQSTELTENTAPDAATSAVSTEPPPVEHLDDASVGEKLAHSEERAGQN